MKADLSKTADFEAMMQLGEPPRNRGLESMKALPEDVEPLPEGVEWVEVDVPMRRGFEAAGGRKKRVPVTKPEALANRDGYQSKFLDGWEIALPTPVGAKKDDALKLKRGGAGHELKYLHFSTVQSKSRRMPLFVGVNIDGTQEQKISRTSIPWCFDGRLDVGDQIGDEVYADTNRQLDRGHMVRREDPIWGPMKTAQQANIDTFHYTNACPQIAEVNEQIWLGLETYVLRNTRKDDMMVSVFTGPVFTDDDHPYRDILVPKSFWKVVAVVTDEGRPSATAYEVSQERQVSGLEFVFGRYKTFQCSIKSIEEKTALSFGDLSKYDGFSVSEEKDSRSRRSRLESLEMVRV
jgi:endonuclease G